MKVSIKVIMSITQPTGTCLTPFQFSGDKSSKPSPSAKSESEQGEGDAVPENSWFSSLHFTRWTQSNAAKVAQTSGSHCRKHRTRNVSSGSDPLPNFDGKASVCCLKFLGGDKVWPKTQKLPYNAPRSEWMTRCPTGS